VRESRPTKISVPMPAATSPGTRTTPIIGPPNPAASISTNAAMRGVPTSVLNAAKLPAAAITARVVAGTSRVARRTAQAPRPAPRAMSGASGPITAPRARPVNAARKIPGSSMAVGGGPPALNPSAGDSPPSPGRYRMVSATSRPASTSSGAGHHTGTSSKPSCPGRSVYSHSCSSLTSHRKPYAAAATGAPTIAASTTSFT
jgi:hypothetical protein